MIHFPAWVGEPTPCTTRTRSYQIPRMNRWAIPNIPVEKTVTCWVNGRLRTIPLSYIYPTTGERRW